VYSSAKKRPLPNNLKTLLILFFGAMAISLVVLVLIFSLFFRNLDFSFKTKELETTPLLEGGTQATPVATDSLPSQDAVDRWLGGVQLNVPGERESAPSAGGGAPLPARAEQTASTEGASGAEFVGVGTDFNGAKEAHNPDVAQEELPILINPVTEVGTPLAPKAYSRAKKASLPQAVPAPPAQESLAPVPPAPPPVAE
jgi:hypothetical protein